MGCSGRPNTLHPSSRCARLQGREFLGLQHGLYDDNCFQRHLSPLLFLCAECQSFTDEECGGYVA